MSMCTFIYRIIRELPLQCPCALSALVLRDHILQVLLTNRLKAASVAFWLRTGSRRLIRADGPAMAKARIKAIYELS